jgi:hypothetical protein
MTENPFSVFDFSEEEVKKVNEEMVYDYGNRDSRVCICGHGMGRHGGLDVGAPFCRPSKMSCACKHPRAVIEVQDTRDFLRKTIGSGPMHALGRGIQTAMEKSHWVKWIDTVACDFCHREGPISPVPVSAEGVVLSMESEYNALMCRECRGA